MKPCRSVREPIATVSSGLSHRSAGSGAASSGRSAVGCSGRRARRRCSSAHRNLTLAYNQALRLRPSPRKLDEVRASSRNACCTASSAAPRSLSRRTAKPTKRPARRWYTRWKAWFFPATTPSTKLSSSSAITSTCASTVAALGVLLLPGQPVQESVQLSPEMAVEKTMDEPLDAGRKIVGSTRSGPLPLSVGQFHDAACSD
jgi:hypothetical protein